MEKSIEEAINEAINELRSGEEKWLNDFYAQSKDEIRRTELSVLPERGVALRTIAQKKISNALTKVGIENVIRVWWRINTSLLPCYYVFIDWDSVDNSKYRVNVSHEEYAKAQKAYEGGDYEDIASPLHIWLPPAVGGVTAGAVMLIGLFLPGHPTLWLPAILSGSLAGVGTYAVTMPRASSPKTEAYYHGRGSFVVGIDNSLEMMISAAKGHNIKIALEWFSNLKTLTLQACEKKV